MAIPAIELGSPFAPFESETLLYKDGSRRSPLVPVEFNEGVIARAQVSLALISPEDSHITNHQVVVIEGQPVVRPVGPDDFHGFYLQVEADYPKPMQEGINANIFCHMAIGQMEFVSANEEADNPKGAGFALYYHWIALENVGAGKGQINVPRESVSSLKKLQVWFSKQETD